MSEFHDYNVPSELLVKLDEQKNRIAELEKQVKSMEPKAEFLDALRQAGVDNWDGYDYAFDILGDEWFEENWSKV